MRKKSYLLLTIVVISATSLIACSNKDIKDGKRNSKMQNASVHEEFDTIEVINKEPNESQQVTEFPWDDNVSFLKAQSDNDTDVLIAGFCTVLETATDAEKNNIGLAASTVNGTVVKPGEVFSQNKSIGPYTEEKGYQEGSGYVGNKIVKSMGGGVCKVATTLYNTSIASDLEIVERFNHAMPVPYVPYGQDAAVAYGIKDFKFKNNTEHPILIWTQTVDNRVYMGFYGKEKAPEIEWEHETLSTKPVPTEYKKNLELKEDEEKVVIEGMHGEVVKSRVIVKDKDGKDQIKERGNSTYLPMTRIIEQNKQK